MSVYKVGPVPYRGHPPGSTFEAHLEPDAERRAIDRHAIVLIDDTPPTLAEGSYTLPKPKRKRKTRAAEAAGKETADAVTDTDQSDGPNST